MFLTWFEYMEQDVKKKFPHFFWPASNWRAGEFPLNNLATSLIVIPLGHWISFFILERSVTSPQSRVFADQSQDTSLKGTTEFL